MPRERKEIVKYNKCPMCEKDCGFTGDKKYIRLSRPRKFCSRSCSLKFRHKEKIVYIKCPTCKKEFRKWHEDGMARKHCSMKCYNYVRKNNFPKYDYPEKEKKRYKMKKIKGKQIYYHRWVMEQHLGRKLERKEVVHHINGDPHDNRFENLIVMSQSDHLKLEISNWKNSSICV